MSPTPHLRVVAVLEVERGHAVQPRLSQFRRVAVALGQAVVQVHQLLRVILVCLQGEGGEERGETRERERERVREREWEWERERERERDRALHSAPSSVRWR